MHPPSRLSIASILKKLQLSARPEDVPRFSKELKTLLVQDFDSTFTVVKNHKLITQWKSLSITSLVCSELRSWLSSAPLSGKRKAVFRNHLEVCEFVQAAFHEIDAEARKLGIWSCDPNAFLRTILGFVEYTSKTLDKKLEKLDADFPVQPREAADKNVQIMRIMHDSLRDVSDGACLILAQFALRHFGPCTGAPKEEEISAAFELAKRKDVLQQFFDNYSYLNWQAKISGNAISFKAPHPDQNLLEYYRQQLITATDQLDSVPEIAVRMTLRRAQGASTDSDAERFDEFLKGQNGEKVFAEGETVAAELTNKIRKRILEVFDETAELHSRDGRYTIKELVDTWGFLIALAYCADRWTKSMIRRSPAGPFRAYAPIFNKDELIILLSSRLKISNLRADELLRQFTIRDEEDAEWDLFYRPLTQLGGNDIGIASTFIVLSRFYRNIFSIAIKDTHIDLSPRGFKPLLALREEFLKAGFRAGTNKVVCLGGRELTDVDFFFLADQVLFVAQVKVLLEPDSAHERWKVIAKLTRAAEQLQRTVENLPGIMGDLLNDLGVPCGDRKNIRQTVPFILSNIEHATGLRLKGFPVVHFGLLKLLVRGGQIGVLAVEAGIVKQVGYTPLIRGDSPSGADFTNLIQDPRPYFCAMFKPPNPIGQVNLPSGSHVIQVPGFRFPLSNAPKEN